MKQIRTFLLVLLAGLAASPAAFAQERDETLADIRQELTVLYVEIQRLRRELSTTGGVGTSPGGSTFLERLDLLEAELTRLNARTEELENWIIRIVEDGTNRIGDLEFRLVELEGGDVSRLGETTTLGGDLPEGVGIIPQPPSDDGQLELAVGEQADFDRAMQALEEGNYRDAAIRFANFADTYTAGPLTGEAHFFRGEALMAMGDVANAARAYLESFSGYPSSARAPEALYKLGIALGDLGQINEACVSLAEVAARYPDSPVVSDALLARQDLSCP